jgi:Ca2+-binding RTX toxin-like protein
VGNSVDNKLSSGLGNDSLDAGAGNDIVDGGAGNDSLLGGLGNDSLIGGAGDDAFAGGAGNDTISGGDGIDRADYSGASVAMQVNLLSGTASGDGTDVLSGIENVTTGSANDSLVGNSVDNKLSSGLGNDSLDAGAGNDIVDGGAGNDSLLGGLGNDSLLGGLGNDSLLGGLGNDTLTGCFFGANGGRSEIDTLSGGAGNDVFQLGWASGRFYDDGNAKNSGRNDYVLITDFTVGQDKLQLDGSAANYFLGASGVANVSGSGLFYDSNTNARLDATDELIAIMRSANSTQLTAANTVNTAQFI